MENKKTETERRVEKVAAGKVKKKSEGKKLLETFITEDFSSVKSYALAEVIVPAIKKAISDVVRDGIDMLLYGESRGNKSSRDSRGYVSYSSYSSRDRDRRDDRYRDSSRNSARFDDEIVFDTRADAEKVYNEMVRTLREYGLVRVFDLYDMAEITPPYTSHDYGWTSLRNMDIVRVRDGYILKLPKPLPID